MMRSRRWDEYSETRESDMRFRSVVPMMDRLDADYGIRSVGSGSSLIADLLSLRDTPCRTDTSNLE